MDVILLLLQDAIKKILQVYTILVFVLRFDGPPQFDIVSHSIVDIIMYIYIYIYMYTFYMDRHTNNFEVSTKK